MRWPAAAGLALLLGAAAGAQAPALGRSLHGVVLDARNQPLASAIVYLKNQQTKVIHTAITDDQGAYAFHQLTPGAGYVVYAIWRKHQSNTRTDSQYNTSPDVRLDLKVAIQ